MRRAQELIWRHHIRGMKTGAVIGVVVGLILVMQTFAPGVFELRKLIIWTGVTSVLFAACGWFLYGGTGTMNDLYDEDQETD